MRRQGRYEGYTRSWKKAVVTLTEDSKTIEFFESTIKSRRRVRGASGRGPGDHVSPRWARTGNAAPAKPNLGE